MKAFLYSEEAFAGDTVEKAREWRGFDGYDAVGRVSCTTPYRWGHDDLKNGREGNTDRPHVVAVDFGVKFSILRLLRSQGLEVTVVPAQTLTDRLYQEMRNAALSIIREIGVDTIGSNIQFAIDPRTGRMAVIEMNSRVSRSSALASKATNFPIAEIAAKLAVGYTLDEIASYITKMTPVCIEPTLDYCVVKIPRFAFEKFPETDQVLGTKMKSVGETMAIGRTLREALRKAVRGLELVGNNRLSFAEDANKEAVMCRLATPQAERIQAILQALKEGVSVSEIHDATQIDPWFVEESKMIVDLESEIREAFKSAATKEELREMLLEAKRNRFSDQHLAAMLDMSDLTARKMRKEMGVAPVYKVVDTCAAEFEAYTPYFYSTYEQEDEADTDASKNKPGIHCGMMSGCRGEGA
ncbi:MAG: hypothetical protein GF344_03330 [Chitinivibrionales bacterium]|nr:hypothetical protein [Chitinivibrionales bacterium]MBD3356107.1 hypothetical protein [Chitinivibrionales bacterium]